MEKEWCAFGHRFAKRCGTGGCGYDRAAHEDDQRAPVFLQWVDALWQMWAQAPAAFEFNEALLEALAEHAYSGRFGTFLLDCERDRLEARLPETTVSLWSYILHPAYVQRFINPAYVPPAPAEEPLDGDGEDSSAPLTAHLVIPQTAVEALAVWPHWLTRW